MYSPPTTTVGTGGRFCNHVIRNLCVHFIAMKNDLYVDYSFFTEIKKLGIDLYVGTKKYNINTLLNDYNFFQVLNHPVHANLVFDQNCYFQQEEIIEYLYNYLHSDITKNNIINVNPYKERYNNNNDCFVHIRLGDVAWVTEREPGYHYYESVISGLEYERLYIASDSFEHDICQRLLKRFPNSMFLYANEVVTIQFGSTCKNVVLSHGSFSSVIGFLSYFSQVFCPKYDKEVLWSGNMFSIPGWNKIEYAKTIDIREKINYMLSRN